MPIDVVAAIYIVRAMNEIVSHLLTQAVERFGSEAAAAREAGVSQPTFFIARRKGQVGVKLAMGIDKATNGEISKSDLRPDIWPKDEGRSP